MMQNDLDKIIDRITNELTTELLELVEFAEHGTGPEDEDRGPPPDDATFHKIDEFMEKLKSELCYVAGYGAGFEERSRSRSPTVFQRVPSEKDKNVQEQLKKLGVDENFAEGAELKDLPDQTRAKNIYKRVLQIKDRET